ncbi:MAG TPA: Gfo/Idh/MocA family oxidoreductase [Planctomycetota bacterium]|nr:Gfo/Idh/MocA family oxidoreductase [Planctomycetota bacterium]
MQIALIGCGNISKKYLLTAQNFPILRVAAVADIEFARAREKAREFGVPKACSVDELLADKSIELVVNLTTPNAHRDAALKVIAAGKHVFNEKPLAVSVEDAREVLEAARRSGVRVGCAPGTFLGGGLQTCRKLIDDGVIGRPVAASAFMTTPGHERWHPNPDFYYQPGGGPMLDMGPYYLTALCHLLGPIQRVSGSAVITRAERVISSEPRKGQRIRVDTPDHVSGSIEFASGAIATVMTSFAVCHAQLPRIEIYGTLGTLGVPDPNSLRGPVLLRLAEDKEWREVPLTHGHAEPDKEKWGIGVAEMAHALRAGRVHRANGENALHVLEALHAFLKSASEGRHQEVSAPFARPTPLRAGLKADELD